MGDAAHPGLGIGVRDRVADGRAGLTEGFDDRLRPPGTGAAMVLEEGDDLASRRVDPGRTRLAVGARRPGNHLDATVAGCLERALLRTRVDHDRLQLPRDCLPGDSLQPAERPAALSPDHDNDRHRGTHRSAPFEATVRLLRHGTIVVDPGARASRAHDILRARCDRARRHPGRARSRESVYHR